MSYANRHAKTKVQLFDLDLAVAGWRQYAALTAAADRSIANPSSSEVVDLATHRITWVHGRFVELFINEFTWPPCASSCAWSSW